MLKEGKKKKKRSYPALLKKSDYRKKNYHTFPFCFTISTLNPINKEI